MTWTEYSYIYPVSHGGASRYYYYLYFKPPISHHSHPFFFSNTAKALESFPKWLQLRNPPWPRPSAAPETPSPSIPHAATAPSSKQPLHARLLARWHAEATGQPHWARIDHQAHNLQISNHSELPHGSPTIWRNATLAPSRSIYTTLPCLSAASDFFTWSFEVSKLVGCCSVARYTCFQVVLRSTCKCICNA
jgi:hypothetical protein